MKFNNIEKEEEIAKKIVDAAYKVHSVLGPGLLESVYEKCFCHELEKRDLVYKNQLSVPVDYEGITMESALRLDVLVEGKIICEIKAVETVIPLFEAQLLSYLKLMNLRLGFLINFNVPLIKEGIKRMII